MSQRAGGIPLERFPGWKWKPVTHVEKVFQRLSGLEVNFRGDRGRAGGGGEDSLASVKGCGSRDMGSVLEAAERCYGKLKSVFTFGSIKERPSR